jgi:uncharacterized integral membrane protein
MRGFLSFVAGILALALVICGAIFVVENAATRNYSFLRATFSLPLWALVGLVALAGFIVALLVFTPARLAAHAHRVQLRAHAQRLEQELAEARAANERVQSQLTTLQAEHAVAARERDAFRKRLEGLRAAPEQAAAPERAAGSIQRELAGSAPAAAQTTPSAPERTAARERHGANATTPGQVETVRETEQTTAPARQPGLGGRMRTLFGKSATPAEGETPPGPAAPA